MVQSKVKLQAKWVWKIDDWRKRGSIGNQISIDTRNIKDSKQVLMAT